MNLEQLEFIELKTVEDSSCLNKFPQFDFASMACSEGIQVKAISLETFN